MGKQAKPTGPKASKPKKGATDARSEEQSTLKEEELDKAAGGFADGSVHFLKS